MIMEREYDTGIILQQVPVVYIIPLYVRERVIFIHAQCHSKSNNAFGTKTISVWTLFKYLYE